ncbi:MAG TPA: NAD(P)/FAD-dependent oxidoreductase [Rhizomicrobium sp.]|nr:NAD(P)/FAD-dependent oxidoreductase [Rhizomicrobium sp.]
MSDAATKNDDLGFDPAALKAKYRAERDKRVRADGNEQYVEIKGDFAHYLEDPYVAPITRAPLNDEMEVLIVGGGFGGLLAAARLREAGVTDIRIVEKGGDFGGTWYWNRYPGAACDIESYIYLPLLEEVGYMPVEKYTRAPEILAYCKRIGEHFDLYKGAIFQTEVKEARWDEASTRWIVSTNRGDALRARFLIMANGPLHRPKLPGIPGVETYKGHSFHTSRWDYDYTGGSPMGGLDKLKDKVVGIIGTGATSVQCVPHLGESAKQLYVFQRTPSSIDVRNNRKTDPEWVKSLQPGWQQARMDNFNELLSGIPQKEDLVNDGWTDIIVNLGVIARNRSAKAGAVNPGELLELADYRKMEQIRARAEEIVNDPNVAESLKPYYRQFCKRPCFHDDYLPTFNRSNVTLVDTQGQGVERITEKGIVANGKEYELDCIVYGTGFEVGTSYARRSGYEVYGRGGQSLTDKWKDGVATFHGFFSRGFPNLFIVSNSQSGFTANFPHMLNAQSQHMAYVIKHAADHQVRTIEASDEAEKAWIQTIIDVAMMRQQFLEECTPGYYNNEGKPSVAAVRNGPYGAGSIAFIKLLEDWRAEGSLKGLELN